MTDILSSSRASGALGFLRRAEALSRHDPEALPLLALRFRDGGAILQVRPDQMGRVSDALSSGAHFLFEQEFKLHLFGSEYPYPRPGARWQSWPALVRSCCRSCWCWDWARVLPRSVSFA